MDQVDAFLSKSKLTEINECVIKKCKNKENCSTEKKFLKIVEKCFIQKKGKVHMKKHFRQDKCEEQYNLRPTSAFWYIDQEQSYRNFWRLFFKGKSPQLKELTECIFEKEQIFNANMNQEQMKKALTKVKVDRMQKSVDSCFEKVYGKEYSKEQIQRTSCAYKYFVFDPMTKGKTGSCFGGCEFHNSMQLDSLLQDQVKKFKNQ